MLSLTFDVGGVDQQLDLMVDSLAELRPVWAEFSAYMRREVQAVFDSGGNGEWAPRSAASEQRFDASKEGRIAKIEASKYASLVGSLRSAQRKAQRRLANTPQSDSKLTARRQKSVEKFDEKIAEVQRVAAGGEHNPKGQRVLYERIGRREQTAAKKIQAVQDGQLLGRIANSLRIDFDKAGWEMYSTIPWAGAQNDGATVGHGAQIPARTFLQWTPERLAKLAELVRAHVAKKGE